MIRRMIYRLISLIGWIFIVMVNMAMCYRMFFIAGAPTREVEIMIHIMLIAIIIFEISNCLIRYSGIYKFVIIFSLIINSIAAMNICTYFGEMQFGKFLVVQAAVVGAAYLISIPIAIICEK